MAKAKGKLQKGKVPKSSRKTTMDLARAMGILGFASSRWLDHSSGLTPKQELDKAHFSKMMEIMKKRKVIAGNLIDLGCDVNLCTREKENALHYSIIYQMPEIAKKLILKGIDINAQKQRGECALSVLVLRSARPVARAPGTKCDKNHRLARVATTYRLPLGSNGPEATSGTQPTDTERGGRHAYPHASCRSYTSASGA